ncbi:proton-coupled folate transporter-like [Anthonomus grandis grandis]|uniref:proton-coupled folate transporter-like n=1 Tax=Anthonomus grandis grandis TaxID=2921223 RepID=UPI00216522CB|nr:proton-coupled folate transporter-like [Anthonomus grandis grandis]XP_050306772.1 proton-coupled folate transporter-like [Anthonomus grandis grandis]XP_050306773.1 proton-coupled folate transporter-like [Anthonomus grandis grandis]
MGFKPTVEIPIFLATLSFMLTASVSNNLLIYRTCYIVLHYNKTECALLGFVTNNETEKLELLVSPTSTYIALVNTIVQSVLGSVLCLFTAPWSDRFGRRPIIVMGFIGGCISMLFHIIFAAFELTPWFIIVPSLTVLLSGGGASFITILYAYLTDLTNKDERGWRIGIFDLAMAAGVLIGMSSSSYLLIATNYVTVFSIGAALQTVALIYVIFLLPESLQHRETSNLVSGFFTLSNLAEMVKTPFKRRENYTRAVLLLTLLSMLLGYLAMGSAGIFFYFVRTKLQWTLTAFTLYGTVQNILGIFGAVFVMYLLHTYFKIREIFLILVGMFFSIISTVMFGLANRDWQIYLGAVLNLPASGQNSLQRSLVSKLVHEEEVAKIFSTLSIGANVLGPLSAIIYTYLYNTFINIDPGLYNFFTAGVQACIFLLFLLAVIIQCRGTSQPYKNFQNENNIQEDESENIIASNTDSC